MLKRRKQENREDGEKIKGSGKPSDSDGKADSSEDGKADTFDDPKPSDKEEGEDGEGDSGKDADKEEDKEEEEDGEGDSGKDSDSEANADADGAEGKGDAAEEEVGISGKATSDPTDLKKGIKDSLDEPTKPIKSGLDIETLISEDALDSMDFGEWIPYGTDMDTFEPPDTTRIFSRRGSAMDESELLEWYQKALRENMKGSASVLKNQMKRILISEKRCKWVGGKRKGVINPTTLAAASKGTSKSVYRQRKIGKKVNSTVSILVDLSASMGASQPDSIRENKMTVARNTAILLAETLNGIVPFEILGFTGDLRIHKGDAKSFSRWGSLDMLYFKKFNETFGNEQKKRLICMDSFSENYDGESVQFAAKRLLDQPEQKKILFVLSDGNPAAGRCDWKKLAPHLKSVVDDLSKIDDLHIVAFGIKTDAPKHYYPNHIIINDPAEDLAKTVMVELNKILT